MGCHEEEFEEQQLFSNNFFDLGTAFQHTGTWSADPSPPADADDTALDPEPAYNFDETSEIHPLGQLANEATSYYVGLEERRFAPQFEVSQHGDAPSDLSNGVQVYGGYSQGVSHQTYHQPAQDITHVTPQRSEPSQWTSGTSATGSSYFRDDSTVFSGGELDPMTARTSASMSRPGSSHHEGKEHICPTCAKGFDRRSDLKKHTRNHKPKHERPIQCKVCGERWLFKKECDRHMLSHSSPGFRCNFCPKKFTRPDNRKRHQSECPRDPNSDQSRARSSRSLSASSSARALRPKTSSDKSQVAEPKLAPAPGTPEVGASLMYGDQLMSASGSQPYTPFTRNPGPTLRHGAMPTVQEGAFDSLPSSFAQPLSSIPDWMAPDPPIEQREDNVSNNQQQLLTPPQSAEATLAHPHENHNAVVDTYQTESQSPPPSPSPAARPHSNSTRRQHFSEEIAILESYRLFYASYKTTLRLDNSSTNF